MSKITEKRSRTISEDHVTGVKCDGCQKDISGVYFEVVTFHSDWGNDSGDSYEDFEFCSVICLTPHMTNYFEKAAGSEEYQIERKSKP